MQAKLRQQMEAHRRQQPRGVSTPFVPQSKLVSNLRAQLAALKARQATLRARVLQQSRLFWRDAEQREDLERFGPRQAETVGDDLNFDIELSGVFPELTYSGYREFNFRHAGALSLQQDVSDVGGTIWDASIVLAHYFDDLGPK